MQSVIRRAVLLLVYGTSGMGLLLFGLTYTPLRSWLLNGTARSTAFVLDCLGLPAYVLGPAVMYRHVNVVISLDCTIAFPSLLFISAVMSHCPPLRQRLAGSVLGVI